MKDATPSPLTTSKVNLSSLAKVKPLAKRVAESMAQSVALAGMVTLEVNIWMPFFLIWTTQLAVDGLVTRMAKSKGVPACRIPAVNVTPFPTMEF